MEFLDNLFAFANKIIFGSYTNSSPTNGEIWFDGSNFRFREGGSSKLLSSGAYSTDIQFFDANGTWNKPTNAKIVHLFLVGGGGGGGGGHALAAGGTNAVGGNGGNGGSIAYYCVGADSLDTAETVTIGDGGVGGTGMTQGGAAASAGSSGGTTYLISTTTLSAGGGRGGSVGAAQSTSKSDNSTNAAASSYTGRELLVPQIGMGWLGKGSGGSASGGSASTRTNYGFFYPQGGGGGGTINGSGNGVAGGDATSSGAPYPTLNTIFGLTLNQSTGGGWRSSGSVDNKGGNGDGSDITTANASTTALIQKLGSVGLPSFAIVSGTQFLANFEIFMFFVGCGGGGGGVATGTATADSTCKGGNGGLYGGGGGGGGCTAINGRKAGDGGDGAKGCALIITECF